MTDRLDFIFATFIYLKEIIMTITTKKTTIALAASAVLTAGLALSPMIASADANPFGNTELSSGYMQLAEGTCGAKKEAEAKCGANKEATDAHKATKEGKCGEAKCGAEKKAAMKAAHEATCGAEKEAAMKAAKEAKCGAEMKKKMEEGSCGAKK